MTTATSFFQNSRISIIRTLMNRNGQPRPAYRPQESHGSNSAPVPGSLHDRKRLIVSFT